MADQPRLGVPENGSGPLSLLHYATCAVHAGEPCDCPASEREAARGLHSNVTLNLTAREAVALGRWLRGTEHWTSETDAMSAIEKCCRAADRATLPWKERRDLPF